MKKDQKLNRYISFKLFYKLWSYAKDYNTVNSYITALTSYSSKEVIDFHEYDLTYEQWTTMLNNIYIAYNTTVEEIWKLSGLSKSDFAKVFCFEYRTLDYWITGKRNCPDYVKLMLLRYFNMINLGKHVYYQKPGEM